MGLTDDTLLKQLSESDNFKIWNTGSICHLFIASSGFNGINVRNKALENLNRYYKWCEENTDKIAIPINQLQKYIIYIQNNTTKHHNKDNIIKYLEMMES